jgi:hypothetical protein
MNVRNNIPYGRLYTLYLDGTHDKTLYYKTGFNLMIQILSCVPVFNKIGPKSHDLRLSGRFGALESDSTIIPLEMPVPSQGHYGFNSFPVVD